MTAVAVPYGKREIGRIRPGPDQTDAQVVDIARVGPLAGLHAASYHAVPPIKPAPFLMPHIPLYFWVGGLAGGSWLAATAEEMAGGNDRAVVRAGRYLTLGSVLAGTGLLIADLGRPERFLNMLRIMRSRSPMSLGSWALAGFNAWAGVGALVQAAEDGLLGDRPALRRLATGRTAQAAQLVGAPLAMFVASYTGVLLGATAIPAWAERSRTMPALFSASATSSGLAAVLATLELSRGGRHEAARRVMAAQTLALGAEAALSAVDAWRGRRLPSARRQGPGTRAARWATAGLGMLLPAALGAWDWAHRDNADAEVASRATRARRRPPPRRTRSRRRLAAALLALGGSLATRWLTVQGGLRSARTPGDTWQHATLPPGEKSHG